MNINKIKNDILKLKNSKLKIKVNIGRNKHEYYEGIIEKLYNNLFTVNTNKGLKSFTYTDVAIKQVVLSKFT